MQAWNFKDFCKYEPCKRQAAVVYICKLVNLCKYFCNVLYCNTQCKMEDSGRPCWQALKDNPLRTEASRRETGYCGIINTIVI